MKKILFILLLFLAGLAKAQTPVIDSNWMMLQAPHNVTWGYSKTDSVLWGHWDKTWHKVASAKHLQHKIDSLALHGWQQVKDTLAFYVLETRTINGHALNTNVTVSNSDVGLGNVTNDAQVKRIEMGANNGVATLDAGGKVPMGQLPASLMIYKGTWSPLTNSPTLSNGTGVSGWVYKAILSGTTDFGAGPISFYAGDFVIYNGTVWERSVGTDNVVSVNGQQGIITLTTSHITEGTNKYYTEARVSANIDVIHTNRTALNAVSGINTGDQDLSGKVDKITGKGLSTEDYTTAEKTKLSGIAAGANNYVHPTNHPPSIITQDASNRFVSDTEISTWNGKENAFAKNTAFNKNFGTTSGTVLEGRAFGTAANNNTGDFLSINGGTMANTNKVTNLNAELLNGINIERIVYGVNTTASSILVADANLQEKAGFYYYNTGSTNVPSTGNLIHAPYANGGYDAQLLFWENQNRLSFRRQNGLTWGGWNELYHSGNLTLDLTNNTVPKWDATNKKFVNSLVSDDGTEVNINSDSYAVANIRSSSANKGSELRFATASLSGSNWALGKRDDAHQGVPIGSFWLYNGAASAVSMVVTPSNDFGMGTTNPQGGLHISKDSYGPKLILDDPNTTNKVPIEFRSNGVIKWEFGLRGNPYDFAFWNYNGPVSGGYYPQLWFSKNTGNSLFGTSSDNGVDKVQVNGSGYFYRGVIAKAPANSNLKTAGSNANSAFSMLEVGGLYGLYGGVSDAGYAWLQVGRQDGNAALYDLNIQSLGGNTNFGGKGFFKDEIKTTNSTGTSLYRATNTGGDFYVGIDNSAGTGMMAAGQSSAYARIINTNSTYPLILGVANNKVLELKSDKSATYSGNIIMRNNWNISTLEDGGGASRTVFGVSRTGVSSGYMAYIQSPDNDADDGVQIRDRAGTPLVTVLNGGNTNMIGALTVGSTLSDYQFNINSNGRYSTLSFQNLGTLKSQIYWDNTTNELVYNSTANRFPGSITGTSATFTGSVVANTMTANNGLTLGGSINNILAIGNGNEIWGKYGTGGVGHLWINYRSYDETVNNPTITNIGGGKGYSLFTVNGQVNKNISYCLLSTPTLEVTTGASNGKIATSDASGVLVWKTPTEVGIGKVNVDGVPGVLNAYQFQNQSGEITLQLASFIGGDPRPVSSSTIKAALDEKQDILPDIITPVDLALFDNTVYVEAHRNGFHTLSSSATITIASPVNGAQGNIHIIYTGASAITFAVPSGYSADLSPTIKNTGTTTVTRTSGKATISYWICGNYISINGTFYN